MRTVLLTLKILFLIPLALLARQIDTFYGSIDVQEPVLLDLIDSPTFQRLQHIHQYGISYYTLYSEEYNRYDHSLGVFAILRTKGASLPQQIAGLLHDVSHTAFSHVGDWVFGKENVSKDYQSEIHPFFLEASGLGDILRKHGLSVQEILPTKELCPALEDELPNLCADRIDYNIQGAFHRGFISYAEALIIFEDLQFSNGYWISTHPDLMRKLSLFSLFMTETCWGGPMNYLSSRWFADAIIRGMDLEVISNEDLHFGTDQSIWERLTNHQDPIIQQNMLQATHTSAYFSLVNSDQNKDLVIRSKFRGIDPWILTEGVLQRLTTIYPDLKKKYEALKIKTEEGWAVKIAPTALH